MIQAEQISPSAIAERAFSLSTELNRGPFDFQSIIIFESEKTLQFRYLFTRRSSQLAKAQSFYTLNFTLPYPIGGETLTIQSLARLFVKAAVVEDELITRFPVRFGDDTKNNPVQWVYAGKNANSRSELDDSGV